MTIHFAAARPAVSAHLGGMAHGALARRAANDNHAPRSGDGAGHDRLLRDALKHFATHGLSAARQAWIEAERAIQAGEAESYRYWREICGKFDRRMAAALVRKFGE